ncbi:MAG: hypothetical protein QW238_05500 [Candidatus Bathyarchaeia archaeon]
MAFGGGDEALHTGGFIASYERLLEAYQPGGHIPYVWRHFHPAQLNPPYTGRVLDAFSASTNPGSRPCPFDSYNYLIELTT